MLVFFISPCLPVSVFFLERKLEKLQTKKATSKSGKDMLNNFKTQRELHMNQLLESTGTHDINTTVSMENPTFFENLYQTNSVYRHMNPQQALESSEKLPIVHHDQLSMEVAQAGVDEMNESKMLP